MNTAGPFTIVAGETTEITPPDNQAYRYVVILNTLDTELTVQYAGNTQWIQALVASSYQLPTPSTIVTVEPVSTDSLGTVLGTISAIWYLVSEPPPNGYPIPITTTTANIPSGTAVDISGQPIQVDVGNTPLPVDVTNTSLSVDVASLPAPNATTSSVNVSVAGSDVTVYTNGSTAQYCTGIVIDNPATTVSRVTLTIDGYPLSASVPAGSSKSIMLSLPFILPANATIVASIASGGPVYVTALVGD